MAKNPDPNLKLTSSKGVTRTLDDWSTMFHLCLVILPPRPEAAVFIPIAKRIFQVFGDADCRTAFCVVGNEFIAKRRARRRRGPSTSRSSIPTASSSPASGSRTSPRSCTCARTRRSSPRAEGWDPHAWQDVAKEIGEVDGLERADRRGRRRSAAHSGLAGLTEFNALTCDDTRSRMHDPGMGVRAFARVPASPYRGDPLYGCVVVGCQCCAQDVFSKDRNGLRRRSPHMNRRAFRLVLISLVVATLGSGGRPGCRHR